MIGVFLLIVYLICSTDSYNYQEPEGLSDTDLVLSFLVHRHGDRTPVPQYMYLSDNPEVLDELVKPLGYGQLTENGMRTAYELGKFIRRRYGEHLSMRYNRSEIYIRSTDSTRAKMTALVAMSATYPPIGRSWREGIRWVPVPYTTLPLKIDFIMGMNCPTFSSHFEEVSNSLNPEMDIYSGVVERLSSILKRDLTRTPVKIYFAYDVFVSQTSMGLPVQESIQKMMPEIKEAADKAFNLLFGNETVIPMQAGLLLKEFFDVSSSAIAGKPTQKVRIYSAHDTNVYAFEAISRVVPRQGAPSYAAVFALELRRVRETGRYVVVPIYVKSPGEPVQYLQVKGCGGQLCDLQEFYDITSPYLLDVEEWKRRCNYQENLKFDPNGFE
ncbi:prostatic acid phosphatase-like [Battus philenor]|uniref:prostatic acid phosphatase-like n=1 Tax=Battus philenor TaxID=42288 RepID=UPI0035CFE20B